MPQDKTTCLEPYQLDNFINFFQFIPGSNLLVSAEPPVHSILALTEDHPLFTGIEGKATVGRGLFDVLEEHRENNKHGFASSLRHSFDALLQQNQKMILPPQRFDWRDDDGFLKQKYWQVELNPVLNRQSEVELIILSVRDVTDTIISQQKESKSKLLEAEQSLLQQAPVGIALLRGEDLVVETANNTVIKFWGKGHDILGKPITQVLPEIESQGFIELMRQVMDTEEPFNAYEMPVRLLRNGQEEWVYFNFDYLPYYDKGHKAPVGIIIFANEVTEQVRSKHSLLQTQQRFSTLVKSAPFPIALYTGADMLIEFANQAMITTWGKGYDVIGKPYAEAVPELKGLDLFQQLKEVYQSGKALHRTNQRIELLQNGKPKVSYFNYSYTPLLDESGNCYGVLSTAADVTDLALAKSELEISQQKAKLAVGSAELGSYEIDLETNEMITSGRFQEIWGVSQTTDRAAYAAQIVEEDLPVRTAAFEEAFRTSHLNYEARLHTKNKQVKWVKVSGKILFNEQNQPKTILGVIQDISKEKAFAQELEKLVKQRTEELEQAHRQLVSANDYLQNIINVFNTPLQVLTPVYEGNNLVDFRYKLTNEAYAAYTGGDSTRLHNKRISEFFPGYLQTETFARILKTFVTGNPDTWENHYATDGLELHNQMSTTKMGEDVVVHFTDFTKLKNLQLELLRKIDELERSNKNLEEFAYAASHDLKEPIRKIHFYSDRLKNELAEHLTDKNRFSFERLETAARRMASLIDDVLSYSHVSLLPKASESIDLSLLVAQVLADLDLEIELKQARVQVAVLPVINGFPRQLQQAFQNLLTNALKYNKPGIAPEIQIDCEKVTGNQLPHRTKPEEQLRDFLCIQITDNGIGFEAKEAERIFQVFTRLHGNVEYKGTGIGLSIVRKVMENHGGYIHATSKLGEGSVFRLYLPL